MYYHTDDTSTVYHNHATIIVGKIAISSGSATIYRPDVDSHTNDRYHLDYTLYPYVDYQSLANKGYKPSVTIVNIPDWSPVD